MTRDTAPVDNQTYDRFRTLVLERSGLHFPEKRRRDLEKGLWRAVSRSDCPDLESYDQLLARNDTGGWEWEKLICQLTIGETYFFRDSAQFAALRQHILPEIIAWKRPLTRQLRIWSAGCAFFAPDNRHLLVRPGGWVRLRSKTKGNGLCPSADLLFASVAGAFGAGTLGVILTGMGRDGVEGLRQLKSAGGRVLAQDESSAVVFGMPREAIAAGIVDRVVSLGQMAQAILEMI